MLRELAIKSFALIDDVTVSFPAGMSVLTGETGAGKSILVEALGCVCGIRAREEWLREGESKASVSALFQLGPQAELISLLDEAGIEVDEGELILRRDIVRGGRGRAWINGVTVTLAQLRRVGDELLSFHGQHESQTLLAPARHLEILDRFAELGDARRAVGEDYDEWTRARVQLEEESVRIAGIAEQRSFLERELGEIDAVEPSPGEEERLEEQRRSLTHRAKLLSILERAEQELDGDGSANERADRARRALEEGAALDGRLAEAGELVRSALVELSEAASAVSRLREDLAESEDRVDELIDRIERIRRLRKRYGGEIEAVLARREQIVRDLSLADLGAERVEDLRRLAAQAERRYAEDALALSERRRQAAGRLSKAVGRALRDLGMREASLSVDVSPQTRDGGASAGFAWTSRTGVDKVEFYLSPNVGEGRHPLARIASGGELSRILLALLTALGEGYGTFVSVFDEVDAGVGADLAGALGTKLREAARGRQVLVITHFAQIAAQASAHLRVSKVSRGGRTRMSVTELSPLQRAEEMARMLGGDGDIALRHAHDLMSAAGGAASPGGRRRSS